MNIQTTIPAQANSQGGTKPGSVRRGEDGNDGFETALRNKSENETAENAGTEKSSGTNGQFSREFKALTAPNSVGSSVDAPVSAQVRPGDPDAAADPQNPDATADPLEPDQAGHSEAAMQNGRRTEHPPMSAIQNLARRLHALDGRNDVEPATRQTFETAATMRPGSPPQMFERADLKQQVSAIHSQDGRVVEMPVSQVTGKPVAENPGPVVSAAAVPAYTATGRSPGRTGLQIENPGTAPRSSVEGVPGNVNPIEEPNVAGTRAPSATDRAAGTHKSDATAAGALPAGQANILTQQDGAAMPAPPVTVATASNGVAKTNPATGSLLNQLEQVEVIRELAASDRLGFVSRLSQNGGSIQVLRLQLKPAELGTVTAHMRMENGQMTVELIAEKDAAFRQLSKDMSIMQTAMRSMGIIVDEIIVSQGSASAGAHHSTDGQQRGASESRGESGFGQRPGQQSNEGDTTHESSRNNTSDSNSDISSGIYI